MREIIKKQYKQSEVKFLDVDPDKIQRILSEIKAVQVYNGPRKRIYFDFSDKRLTLSNRRIALTIEDKLKLEYSQKYKDGNTSTIKVFVSREKEITDFLSALEIEKLFEVVSYRISYELPDEGVDFDLDFWPKIPAFLEVDAPNIETLRKYALLLGLDPQNAKRMNTREIYAYYQVEMSDLPFDRSIEIKPDDSLESFINLFGTGIGKVGQKSFCNVI